MATNVKQLMEAAALSPILERAEVIDGGAVDKPGEQGR
jgi:hypothetical protein